MGEEEKIDVCKTASVGVECIQYSTVHSTVQYSTVQVSVGGVTGQTVTCSPAPVTNNISRLGGHLTSYRTLI